MILVAFAVLGMTQVSTAQTPTVSLPPPVGPSPNICLAGTGSVGWCGDGDLATRGKLANPNDVAIAPDGTVIVADTGNQVIRSIDAAGRIATIAGKGVRGVAMRTTSARRAWFRNPAGVTVDADGSVVVADTGNNAIRRIEPSGRVLTFARPQLSRPTDVVALPGGGYAVADSGNHRVVHVSVTNVVTPLAGTGVAGHSGDGGPAIAARLDAPVALAVSGAALLIVDNGNGSVRRLESDGTISTVAGRPPGGPGPTPATQVVLESPRGVAATASGGLVVSDLSRLWAVGADGSIQPLAGTGVAGFNGDAGAALELRLNSPTQMATAADGAILVVDRGSHRIRRLAQDGSALTIAGSGDPTFRFAPVARAPFRPAPRRRPELKGGSVPKKQLARSYKFSGASDAPPDDPPPQCAAGTTTSNLVKIRPFSQKRFRGRAAKAVVIRTAGTVDYELTAYAWRNYKRYGTRTKQAAAGLDQIKLRGRLEKNRYYAVINAITTSGERICDARPMEIE